MEGAPRRPAQEVQGEVPQALRRAEGTEGLISHRKRVLVVEDDRDFLELVTLALTRAGYDVRPCVAGREALDAVREHSPDLVVLDVMLPGLDGYTIRHQLAQRPETRRLPVVVLTALEPSRKLFQDGRTVFLAKPVRAEDLLQAVAKAIE